MDREAMVDAASRVGEVIRAAERLGIAPKEAAERVVAAMNVKSREPYEILRSLNLAARALK